MAMRNYGAMLDAKLKQCIAELRDGRGDAYDRVIAKQHMTNRPEADVGANLQAALAVAMSRGIVDGATTAPIPDPEPPKINSVCRGCAGTGVDYGVHARLLQSARGPWEIGPKPGAKRLTTSHVVLGPGADVRGSVGSKRMSLVALLDALAKASGEGREVKCLNTGMVTFPLTKADACTWCHGTGEPQLSVQALRERVES